jgi:hypothetical protein
MPTIYRDVDFGSAHAGIATVGYQVLDSAGSVVIARTTSGVFEIGGGKYGANFTVAAGFVGTVYWDTTSGSAVSACERIDLAGVTLAAGTITDASFTVPAESGPPTGVVGMLVWLAQRMGLRRVRKTATAVQVYAAGNVAVRTSNAYTSTEDTDDVGAAT